MGILLQPHPVNELNFPSSRRLGSLPSIKAIPTQGLLALGHTRNSLAVSQALNLPVEDAAPSVECLQELHLLFVDDVFHHLRVFLQLREGITLRGTAAVS